MVERRQFRSEIDDANVHRAATGGSRFCFGRVDELAAQPATLHRGIDDHIETADFGKHSKDGTKIRLLKVEADGIAGIDPPATLRRRLLLLRVRRRRGRSGTSC